MKHIITLLAFFFAGMASYAQTPEDLGKIIIGVQFQKDCSTETNKLKPQLLNKMRWVLSQAGYSTYTDEHFVLYPNVIIRSEDVAEAGMKNVYLVKGDLYLTIMDKRTNTIYSTGSIPFKGSNTDKTKALASGINDIDYSSAAAQIFDEAKNKIFQYYIEREDLIFAKVEEFEKQGNHDAALACLFSIPEDVPGLYKRALSRATDVFTKMAEEEYARYEAQIAAENEETLNKARGFLSMHDPLSVIKTLWAYKKNGTPADKEYDNLLKEAEKKISQAEEFELEKQKREYEDNKEREEREYQRSLRQEEYNWIERQHKMGMQDKALELTGDALNAAKEVASEFLKAKTIKF